MCTAALLMMMDNMPTAVAQSTLPSVYCCMCGTAVCCTATYCCTYMYVHADLSLNTATLLLYLQQVCCCREDANCRRTTMKYYILPVQQYIRSTSSGCTKGLSTLLTACSKSMLLISSPVPDALLCREGNFNKCISLYMLQSIERQRIEQRQQ